MPKAIRSSGIYWEYTINFNKQNPIRFLNVPPGKIFSDYTGGCIHIGVESIVAARKKK